MAEDYDDIYDLSSMDDGEIRDLIIEQLSEYPTIDPDLVDVAVSGGRVRLSGRVGTEEELQQVEHVLTDVIGVERVSNELVVDELVRAEQPEAADESAAGGSDNEPLLGDSSDQSSPEAEHLTEDLAGDLYGTRDVQDAIEGGQAYNPPDNPVQEGTWSRENH